MRVFAQKQLSVVSSPINSDQTTCDVNSEGRFSFRGWLQSVTSDRLSSPIYRRPRLTAQDVARVNHATIREGESHCIWPPSVFEQFWGADVIRESNTQHYVLRDANLTRVEHKKRQRGS